MFGYLGDLQVPLPNHLSHLPFDSLQFTLVDCPGHASLIRTIIGGAHIMDFMLLVIDITKGTSGSRSLIGVKMVVQLTVSLRAAALGSHRLNCVSEATILY